MPIMPDQNRSLRRLPKYLAAKAFRNRTIAKSNLLTYSFLHRKTLPFRLLLATLYTSQSSQIDTRFEKKEAAGAKITDRHISDSNLKTYTRYYVTIQYTMYHNMLLLQNTAIYIRGEDLMRRNELSRLLLRISQDNPSTYS